MKKLFILLVSTIIVLYGMPSMATTIGLMPKVGLNLANMSLDPEVETPFEKSMKLKLGIVGGLGAEIGLGTLAVEADLLYSQKGLNIKGEVLTVKIDYTTKIDYLAIPIIGKAVLPAGTMNIFIGAGPEIGMLLSAKETTKIEGVGESSEETTDVKDDFESTDLGLVIAGGVEISNLIIEARYVLGLSDIAKDKEQKAKNSTISILVGYKFGL